MVKNLDKLNQILNKFDLNHESKIFNGLFSEIESITIKDFKELNLEIKTKSNNIIIEAGTLADPAPFFIITESTDWKWHISSPKEYSKDFHRDKKPILSLSFAKNKEKPSGSFFDENGEETITGIYHLKEDGKTYFFLDGVLEIEASAKDFETPNKIGSNLPIFEQGIKELSRIDNKIMNLYEERKANIALLKEKVAESIS